MITPPEQPVQGDIFAKKKETADFVREAGLALQPSIICHPGNALGISQRLLQRDGENN